MNEKKHDFIPFWTIKNQQELHCNRTIFFSNTENVGDHHILDYCLVETINSFCLDVNAKCRIFVHDIFLQTRRSL